MNDDTIGCAIYTGITLVVIAVIAGALYLFPHWRVYSMELSGVARLREAESSRRILIEEAKAQKEAATLFADAEIERAKGVAEANAIIGDSLKGNDAYLRYLWIQQLGTNGEDVIYVPTEAGLPILEATRLQGKE